MVDDGNSFSEELIKREANSPSDEVEDAGAAQLQVNTLKQQSLLQKQLEMTAVGPGVYKAN